jgi:hypothetical protein
MKGFINYFNTIRDMYNKGEGEQINKFISKLNIEQVDEEHLNNIDQILCRCTASRHAIIIILYILNSNSLSINKLENNLFDSNLQINKLNDNILNLQDEIKQNKLKILQLETNNYNRTKLINSSFKILYIVCNILVLCIILYKFQIYIY